MKNLVAGGGGGVMNWETGIDIYTLICIKWITNKNLLYKKINKIQRRKCVRSHSLRLLGANDCRMRLFCLVK